MTAGDLAEVVRQVREAMVAKERVHGDAIATVHAYHRERARNLIHFLAFREFHGADLGNRLLRFGLDPLTDVEWDVLNRIDSVLARLQEMCGTPRPAVNTLSDVEDRIGRETLRARTEALFGPPRRKRQTRIMLTLPTETAEDPALAQAYVSAGVDCFRINCARDNRDIWARMIEGVRKAEGGRQRALIFMDLGGSKLRVTAFGDGGQSIRLATGDLLTIEKKKTSLSAMSKDDLADRGPQVAVNDPSALSGVVDGHRIWFDDGKIGGVVRKATSDALRVEITFAKKGGKKLRLERGLNLPDTPMSRPALTEKDLEDLPFAARHADFLALSFVRTASDVGRFLSSLAELSDVQPAVVIKIETREALDRLPELMLAGMQYEKVAMLLARGDLATECGFLDMPGIQQNVLRLCAAAGLPLFWATGVLDRASRTGESSRAEITDAAVAAKAQCIMLNKGPQILDAIHILNGLLERSGQDT